MEKNYAVCKLPDEDNDVIIVCTTWLCNENQSTMYPPKSMGWKLNKMLKDKVLPELTTWKTYPIEIMGFYHSYEKAESKSRVACETSNLESMDEEEAKKSRNKRRKITFDDGDSSDEDQQPDRNLQRRTFEKPSLSPPPAYPDFNALSSLNNKQGCSSTLLSPMPATFQQYHPSSPTTPSIRSNPQTPQSRTSTIQAPEQAKERLILAQIQMVMGDLCRNQKIIMEDLKNIKASLRDGRSPGDGAGTDSLLTEKFANFPLSSVLLFEDFEQTLVEGRKKDFIDLMIGVGGLELGQAIHGMLRRTMEDELAMQFSFSGKLMGGKTKRCLGKTQVAKCILVAAQKRFGNEATEMKFASTAGKWFQQAKTRVDRKTKKKGPNAENLEEDNETNENGSLD